MQALNAPWTAGAIPARWGIMDKGNLFYLLMVLWVVLGSWAYWPASGAPGGPARYGPFGSQLLLFCLILILGWHAFGPPIK